MKIFRKILYVALIVSIILILCPMETYAETETTVQKKMSITSDDTLTYTVNITSQNGQVNIEAIANQVTIDTVANEGYVLDTLTVTDKDGNAITLNGNKFTMPAKDIDIKANFKKQEYTVNFNSVGGSDVSSQTLRHGEVLITPTPPTKANYIFDGWYYEEECITKYDFATPVTASFYLYVKWIPCEHSFEWKIDVEPTTTKVGSKHEECIHCGAIRNNNTEIPVVKNTVFVIILLILLKNIILTRKST